MTQNYLEIVEQITKFVMEDPNIQIGEVHSGDIYEELNGKEINMWPVLFISPVNYQPNYETGISTFNINMFYVDRLVEGRFNREYIWSTGFQTLDYIMFNLQNSNWFVDITSGVIQPFVEPHKFVHDCNGNFVQVSIDIPSELCSGNDINIDC